MKTIKSLSFLDGRPADINSGWSDVIVTLEGNDEYLFEIVTPQALVSYMKEKKRNFLEPVYPFIIVRELTPVVIQEAIEAFIIEREDGFWFKLYYSIPFLTIDDLNLIIDRHKKEIQDESEED